MRIILATDPPWASTSNAVQMGELAKRLQADLHTVYWMPRYGFSNGGSAEWEGIEILAGDSVGGNDILELHVSMKHAELVITRGYAESMKFGGSDYAWFAWHPGAVGRNILRRANKCIAVSKHEVAELEAVTGVLPVYIPRGIASAFTKGSNDKEAVKRFRNNHRIPDDAFVFSAIGPTSDTNWTLMMEAFKEFHDRHDNALLYLQTDSNTPIDLNEYAARIGLPLEAYRVPDGYNLHVGYFNESIAAMYRMSDIHLVPGEASHPIIESMACATPVIVNGHAEAEELMYMEGLGATVPPAMYIQGHPLLDVEGWVEQMERAYAMSEGEAGDHGACSRMAVEVWKWDTVYRDYWKPLLATFEAEERTRADLLPLKPRRAGKRDSKFLYAMGFDDEFGCEVVRKTDIGGSVQDEKASNDLVKSWGPHPNVIRILRDGTDDAGHYYFDTPKLTPLDEIKQFTTQEGDRILAGIRAGLAFMHEHGAAHCDINPTNILLTEGGEAIIFDFDFMAAGLEPRVAALCDFDPLHTDALPYAVPVMASGIATRGFHRVVTHVRNLPFDKSLATSKPDMPYQQVDGVGERDCEVRWSILQPDVRGKRVVDLGTNLGYFAARAMREGAASVVAVDRDEHIVEAARTLHPELDGNVRQMQLNDELPEGEFDVAFCLSIWQHLRDGKRPLLEYLKRIPVVYWEDSNLTKPELEQMGFKVERLERSERGRNLFKLTSEVTHGNTETTEERKVPSAVS